MARTTDSLTRRTHAVIRIVGHHLPGRSWAEHRGVHVGVQYRSEVEQLAAGDASRAKFSVPVEVRVEPEGGVDYRGPFVHGPRGDRFVYLSWGDVDANGGFSMFRRAKLKLLTLPDELTGALAEGRTVQIELDLTDAKGGPLCASIASDALTWTVDDPAT